MSQKKIEDLIGDELDGEVASCLGVPPQPFSSSLKVCADLVTEEQIGISPISSREWIAKIKITELFHQSCLGPTPAVAAMRCLVKVLRSNGGARG